MFKVIPEEQVNNPDGGGKRSWLADSLLPDHTVASVRCKDDDGGDRRLQGPVQVGEALDVQHVDLINKEHTWNQLRNALINVLVHHLVNLPPKFV